MTVFKDNDCNNLEGERERIESARIQERDRELIYRGGEFDVVIV